ncbi:MAG: tyrosine-type recombinase/integrase [Candidatus Borkfalkiaceae bacterium]|nr:tyrosine-type recombinase/integrase [Christensenellaceae bacterium]
MDNANYFLRRNIKCEDKIEALMLDMPYFCSEFFYGTANNTSALTRLNYAYDLRIFFRYLSEIKKVPIEEMKIEILDEVTSTDIERFLNYLSHYVSDGKEIICDEKGKKRKLSTVRALFRYFFNKNEIKANVAAKIPTPKLHEKEIIRLEGGEVNALLAYADSDEAFSGRKNAYHEKTKERDYAILSLFLGTGIRISELVGLNIDDFDFNENAFVVTRKGGSRTTLYFNDEVKDALLRWLDFRYDLHLENDEKAMFVSLRNVRISTRAVEVLVKNYAKEVTPLKKITPHKLRSTFGTNLYRKTGDIYAVADFLGHKDVNTTRKHYAAISQDSRKNAIEFVKLRDDDSKDD